MLCYIHTAQRLHTHLMKPRNSPRKAGMQMLLFPLNRCEEGDSWDKKPDLPKSWDLNQGLQTPYGISCHTLNSQIPSELAVNQGWLKSIIPTCSGRKPQRQQWKETDNRCRQSGLPVLHGHHGTVGPWRSHRSAPLLPYTVCLMLRCPGHSASDISKA